MEKFISDLGVVLVGSAVLSVIAVVLRQPIIIAYVVSGVLLGPSGFGWIERTEFIELISHLGITLLLFLAGLCLHPQKLVQLFQETALVTVGNCLVSFLAAFSFARVFHFDTQDSLCVGLAMMFSSTILVVKLLPTTRLHQEKMGAVCIGILIMQDLLAVGVLAFIRCLDSPQGVLVSFSLLTVKLGVFVAVLLLLEQYVLREIMRRVERLHEVLFVLGLAWCFGLADISNRMGLFYETGAFFAGVVVARHPIALFISERLKPLRDFFLVLFFFTLGAKLNFSVMKGIWLPAVLLTVMFIVLKPWVFRKLFILTGENMAFSHEAGVRLGQLSEFSLLVVILAFELGHISLNASQLVQLVTILTFIISSYIVVWNYPTPIGTSEKLIRD
jgi:Kef-type K+ transport system membrane component KefB